MRFQHNDQWFEVTGQKTSNELQWLTVRRLASRDDRRASLAVAVCITREDDELEQRAWCALVVRRYHVALQSLIDAARQWTRDKTIGISRRRGDEPQDG